MPILTDFLKTEYAKLELREILSKSPTVLLGVSDAAAEQLSKLAVKTVFELAFSRVFKNAQQVVQSGRDQTDPFSRAGKIPADIVSEVPADKDIAALQFENIEILTGVGKDLAPGSMEALAVTTVRDLALWPPFLAAQSIVNSVLGLDKSVASPDNDAPAALLPGSGEYPTERVFYKTIVFDAFEGETKAPLPLVPIDISAAVAKSDEFGFTVPAVGAILTYSQSWYTQGLALGQLLHSVALAPGESTRVAVIDWARRTSAAVVESISEAETLSNTTSHNRSISEVTRAVASEAQSGFSGATTNSTSNEVGGSAGGFFGGTLGLGGSYGRANSTTNASSFSSSSGRRDLSASMAQNILDSTHQAANAARNRRASIVREVSQEESQKISTRVVTNYNHMHALSIHYYEVVQIYQVQVQLSEVEKCLFVPMKLIQFKDDQIIRRFRSVLADAALNASARKILLQDPDTLLVEAASDPFGSFSPDDDLIDLIGGGHWQKFLSTFGPGRATTSLARLPSSIEMIGVEMVGANYTQPSETRVEFVDGDPEILTIKEKKWPFTSLLDKPVPLSRIRSVVCALPVQAVSGDPIKDINEKNNGTMCNIILSYQGKTCRLRTFATFSSTANPIAKVINVKPLLDNQDELVSHLQSNSLYYNQAIWSSMDGAALALLLSPYSFQDKPILESIDPTPVAVAGNYLVFRMHQEQADPKDLNAPEEAKKWSTWLADHRVDKNQVHQQVVPLPSGGVFAEAVLGRSNAAEKLDMTRFWNWQDSPIPDQATPIAPIQSGSRATSEDLKPGNLSQPLVNIVGATPLPDPQGLNATLNAISNANMFRDMSGLASVIGLAQAALNATSTGAGRAGELAADNMATAGQFQVEMVKALLPLIGAAMGVPVPPSGAPSTISNQGAKINQGKKLDESKNQLPDNQAAIDGGVLVESSTAGGSGSNGNGGRRLASTRSGSHEVDAFNQAIGINPAVGVNSRDPDLSKVLTPSAPATPGELLPASSGGRVADELIRQAEDAAFRELDIVLPNLGKAVKLFYKGTVVSAGLKDAVKLINAAGGNSKKARQEAGKIVAERIREAFVDMIKQGFTYVATKTLSTTMKLAKAAGYVPLIGTVIAGIFEPIDIDVSSEITKAKRAEARAYLQKMQDEGNFQYIEELVTGNRTNLPDYLRHPVP